MADQPAPRTLILLRHGRTAWNHEGRVQGQQDVGLDDTGLAQAAAVAPALAALRPSVMWCSDLGRARQTAEPLATACGLDVAYDQRLREFSFGERERLTHAEFAAIDPDGFQALRTGDYDAVPGCEQTAEVRARMTEVLRELLDVLAPGETGVAVSHGAAIRVATAALLGWPDDQLPTLRGLSNCGWAVLAHRETGGLALQAYNRTVG